MSRLISCRPFASLPSNLSPNLSASSDDPSHSPTANSDSSTAQPHSSSASSNSHTKNPSFKDSPSIYLSATPSSSSLHPVTSSSRQSDAPSPSRAPPAASSANSIFPARADGIDHEALISNSIVSTTHLDVSIAVPLTRSLRLTSIDLFWKIRSIIFEFLSRAQI